MENSTITIIGIFLAAILMFVFPLMSMSDRTDDVTQLAVQTLTNNFVDNVRTTGVLSQADYLQFLQDLSATGNSYDVETEIQFMDENPNKKSVQTDSSSIGGSTSYKMYTSQIEEMLDNNGSVLLKPGDLIISRVKNTNLTISQQIKNFLYRVTGNDTYQIAAQQSGLVTANGK